VDAYAEKLKNDLPKRGRTPEQIREVIGKYTGQKFTRRLSSKGEKPVDKLGTLRNIALCIVAVNSGTSYKTLYNFYYPIKKKNLFSALAQIRSTIYTDTGKPTVTT